jgi:broad specificity phosphatase PhoE
MRVILLRHGETAWNRDGVFRGTEDVPLNEHGKEQAALAGERLRAVEIRRIYTSPLSRSRDTAERAAGPKGLAVADQTFLNDMYFGRWQGLKVEEVALRWPDEYRLWQESPHLCQAPGGESIEGVMQRAARGLENLLREDDGGSGALLLVSHRVIIKLLLLWAVGAGSRDFWKIRVDTCSLSSFLVKKHYCVIETINDTCHLRKRPSPTGPDF